MATPVTRPDADITVTTATRSAEEVRATLGEEKPAAPVADPKAAEKPAAPAGAPTPEQEADSERPDPQVSDAARMLRQNRLSDKAKRLTTDNALYEETIRDLGGEVPPARELKADANWQEKVDHQTRRRHDLLAAVNKSAKARRSAPPPAPAAAPPAAPAAPKAPEEPKFEFPTWDDYQAKYPDRDYTQYTDERVTALYRFNEKLRTDATRKTETETAEAAAFRAYDEGEEAIRAEYADYDQVTSLDLSALGDPTNRQHPAAAFKAAILREGKNGPALLYFIGKHPEYVARLAQTKDSGELFAVVGEIRYAARAVASLAAPAPAGQPPAAPVIPGTERAAAPPPAKPKPEAPAPLAPVPGSASHVRTPEQAARDTEDADEYMERRREQLRPRAKAR